MSYTIKLLPEGQQFSCEDDQPILDAALDSGLRMAYSCYGGSCGACRMHLEQGEVDYAGMEPYALTDAEVDEGYILPCIAHPLSDCVLTEEKAAVGEVEAQEYQVRVARIERLNHDVVALFLQFPAAKRFEYRPGQYVEFLLKDGSKRAFSIASIPAEDNQVELHIRHVEGGRFTDFVFNELQPGQMLRVSGPHGRFYLREDLKRPIIMIAGGTGLAPVKGLVQFMQARSIQRPVHLFWGVRALRDLYSEVPAEWALNIKGFRYTPVLSEPAAEDEWPGKVGWVHDIVAEAYSDFSAYDIYLCGPPVMIQACREMLLNHGAKSDRMFADSFDFAPRKSS